MVWVESNVIVFCNLVFGVCINWYGDFIDICVVVIGRVFVVGLYFDELCLVMLVVDF